MTWYRTGDISDRTVFNKSADIGGWFRWMGLDVKILIRQKINYTKSEVEIYEPEEWRGSSKPAVPVTTASCTKRC